LTQQTNQSLHEINVQAQKINDILNEISGATGEQSVGISQILNAVAQIEQVVKVNSTYANTIEQISKELLHNISTGIGEIERVVNGGEA